MRLLLVLAALYAPSAFAQDFVGARALGLADAYRATATGNDAIYWNPAGLVVVPRFALEGHYELNIVDEQHQGNFSLVDSKTNKLAAGLGWMIDGRDITNRPSVQNNFTGAAAYPLLDQLLSAGVAFKYTNVQDAILGNLLSATSADIGLLSRLPFGVSLGAVGYNLIVLGDLAAGEDLFIQSARIPISAGFAANLDLGPLSALLFGGGPSFRPRPNAAGMPTSQTMGELVGPLSGLTVETDWQMDFVTLYGIQSRVSTGVEYLAFDSVPLRLGYQWDQGTDVEIDPEDHLVSIGAGFIVPSFGLDVGYQQSMVNFDTRLFAISTKFFLNL